MRSLMIYSRSILGLLAACLITASTWAVPYYGGLSRPFPGPGVPPAIDSFFDVFFDLRVGALGDLSIQGNAQSLSFPLNGLFHVIHQPDSNFDNVFLTEMVSLNLSGGGVSIRESPTLASTGMGIVTPDGSYVASFFDVFFELSLDGGLSWRPSNGPVHVSRVPESGSTIVMMLIVLGMMKWVRRKSIS